MFDDYIRTLAKPFSVEILREADPLVNQGQCLRRICTLDSSRPIESRLTSGYETGKLTPTYGWQTMRLAFSPPRRASR
jgi:hypothetical protein